MSRLFMVRHGPTHAKSMVGWSDIPADLSDAAAISRLKAHLPTDAIVVSSDLSRAIKTADAIMGDQYRLPNDANLRELNFGDWELKRFDEVEDQDHIRTFWDQPGDIAAPNGESWNDISTRVNRAIDGLFKSHSGRNIVVVAHFGVILTQVQRALGISAYDAFGHKIDNLSVTELSFSGTDWKVADINLRP